MECADLANAYYKQAQFKEHAVSPTNIQLSNIQQGFSVSRLGYFGSSIVALNKSIVGLCI